MSRRRKVTPERFKEIYTEYVKGEQTAADIARRYGIVYTTLLDYLGQYGLPRRPRGLAITIFPTPEQVAAAVKLREEGESFRAIGHRFNVSDSVIIRWLREAGHETRRGKKQ